MLRCFLAFAAMALLAAQPAVAQDGTELLTGTSETEGTETASPAIEAERDAGEDQRIAQRISGIFAAIDGLSGVSVEVEEGVVTLSGTAGADQSAQADDIAGRVAGVVTVDNNIERDVAVSSNITPALQSIIGEARNLLRLSPLLAVALLVALLVILLTRWLASAGALWARLSPNGFVAELMASAVRFIGVLFGIYLALKILGATALLGALLGIGGVIGIAIGFAVRDTIDNYISSVMLSLRQPFRANDHVVIEGEEGRVVRLTSRATILMTLDGNHLRIPNSTVFKAVILNYTRNPQRRFAFDLGVDADDDPVDGMAVGLEALQRLDFVLKDPEASAWVVNVGDSNIVLRFFGWVDQDVTDFNKGRSLAIRAAKTALEEAGFALPEPIYRLRMDPRSAPLPTSTPGSAEGQGAGPTQKAPEAPVPVTAPAKAQAAPGAEAMAADIKPESHIADLVNKERADTGEGDLLDSRRPIE